MNHVNPNAATEYMGRQDRVEERIAYRLSREGRPGQAMPRTTIDKPTYGENRMTRYATKHRISLIGGPIDGISLPRSGRERPGDEFRHFTPDTSIVAIYAFTGEIWRYQRSIRVPSPETADDFFGLFGGTA